MNNIIDFKTLAKKEEKIKNENVAIKEMIQSKSVIRDHGGIFYKNLNCYLRPNTPI